jgi:hypothetical protein
MWFTRCSETSWRGGQLTERASTGFESWAKESYEIATRFAYRKVDG